MPIDVQIIPELTDALGAGFEKIIYELNGSSPVGGSSKPKPKSRKRKVKGGDVKETLTVIEGGSKRSKSRKSRKVTSPKRKSVRKAKSKTRKSPSRKTNTIKVGPRTAMGYFLERNKQVVLGPFRTKEEAGKAKLRLQGIMHML
jgi:hypothetical protein